MIQPERIQKLNHKTVQAGSFVAYWMQASQRAHYNHALEYAIQRANELYQPLMVFFALTDDYPAANLRHYCFMLEGLRETQIELKKRRIPLIIIHESPVNAVRKFADSASLIVTDRGYLNIQRQWRKRVAQPLRCALFQVESDAIVPVNQVSNKEEYAARTIRPKIHKLLSEYLKPLNTAKIKKPASNIKYRSFDLSDIDKALSRLRVDRSVGPVKSYIGGSSEAKKRLRNFIKTRLEHYGEKRNDPAIEGTSGLSPYLHFGQISPLYIALEISKSELPDGEVFLEELIVRRELSLNFCEFTEKYNKYNSLPGWVRATLRQHSQDKRPYIYTVEQLEAGKTHDDCWNAAQLEMVHTGKMHGYMRMYWGKKILEWSPTPQKAFKIAIYLNDKYQLDGRDPNSYAGVAWCFGKHDRPWQKRLIFGTVRYMNEAGLKRKFKLEKYIKKVNRLITP